MTINEFTASLLANNPPAGLSEVLLALWHDGRGDWEGAHTIAQDVHTQEGSWVHAYLHRKEGDDFNAGYWYRKAGQPAFQGTLEEEWTHIVTALL